MQVYNVWGSAYPENHVNCEAGQAVWLGGGGQLAHLACLEAAIGWTADASQGFS